MDFSKKMSAARYPEFAHYLMSIYQESGGSWSSRGWCYILEGKGVITKNQFTKVNTWLNDCIKRGLIPVDVVAQDRARMFDGVYSSSGDPVEHVENWFDAALNCHEYYDPDYMIYGDEKYYIQVVVEKVDLVKILSPVCRKYLIPIANAKGWPSVLQRAEYCERFKRAEERGLTPVLLYAGDYDPDGLRIADTIKSNLTDVKDIVWLNGETGYDPKNLIIKRVGIKLDFIKKHNLPWIDNLITTNKKGISLASPTHKNHYMPYVQDYLHKIGVRKCEANAVVLCQDEARDDFEQEIINIVGPDLIEQRKAVRERMQGEIADRLEQAGAHETVRELIERLRDNA